MAKDSNFDPWKQGDIVGAGRLNKLQDVIHEIGHELPPQNGGSSLTRYVRLTQWIGPESNFVDRTGVEQYLDPSTGNWGDIPGGRSLTKVTDPTQSQCYCPGMIIPVRMHWSGKMVPEWPGLTTLRGYLSTSLSPGSSATMRIWISGASGTLTDSGVDVTVWANPLLPDDADPIDTGAFVEAFWQPPAGASIPARWEAGMADCAPEEE